MKSTVGVSPFHVLTVPLCFSTCQPSDSDRLPSARFLFCSRTCLSQLCLVYCRGLNDYQHYGSIFFIIAIVSDTSNILQIVILLVTIWPLHQSLWTIPPAWGCPIACSEARRLCCWVLSLWGRMVLLVMMFTSDCLTRVRETASRSVCLWLTLPDFLGGSLQRHILGGLDGRDSAGTQVFDANVLSRSPETRALRSKLVHCTQDNISPRRLPVIQTTQSITKLQPAKLPCSVPTWGKVVPAPYVEALHRLVHLSKS